MPQDSVGQHMKIPAETQLLGFSTLIQLQRQSARAEDINEFKFLAVNETLRLLHYHQAIFFEQPRFGKAFVSAVSGVPAPDLNAPYLRWLKRLMNELCKRSEPNRPLPLVAADVPKSFHQGWQEWLPDHLLFHKVELNSQSICGFLLSRDTPWQEVEISLAGQLFENYGRNYYILQQKRTWQLPLPSSLKSRLLSLLIVAALVLIFMTPVQLSVLAPAKVTAGNPHVITAPLDGVVKKIHVRPNQPVQAGDLLLSLDETVLKNRYEVARKALDVAIAELKRSQQKNLLKSDSGSDVDLLKAKVARKEAELEHTADALKRIEVRAPAGGVALFADVDEFTGRPVVVGERIMSIADPDEIELEIHVPLDNAILLEAQTPVQFFLNIDPTRTVLANLLNASYEAEVTEENILAYIARAQIDPAEHLRIGLRGTAKIIGRKTTLFYYLFRRPLATIRRVLGL